MCGVLANNYIGSLLVSLLVEVGCTETAQHVFDRLADANDCAWNALIIGYARALETERTFILYKKMQALTLQTSTYAYVALLKICSRMKDMDRGHQMHSDVVDRGLGQDPFVGSTLIGMYAECGFLEKAKNVFDKLPTKDAVAWSTLIAANVKNGNEEEALNLLAKMQMQGVIPTAAALVCALKACGCLGDSKKGQEIHADIARLGLLAIDTDIGNSIVYMYATLGMLAIAQEVFAALDVRDRFSCTALMTGYTEHGHSEDALALFDCMQLETISQDAVTFICALTACRNLQDSEKTQEIHVEVARRGFIHKDVNVGNVLVDAYTACGWLAKAVEVFESLPVRDVVSWTVLISGFTKCNEGERALQKFERMEQEGIVPNSHTYVCALQACGSIEEEEQGQVFHAEISRKGLLDSDVFIRNAVVGMYANCGLFAKARELFDQFKIHDTVFWNILISGYLKHNCNMQVLDSFREMQNENTKPNSVTYTYVLKGCALLGAVWDGQRVHSDIARVGLTEDFDIGNTLVDMYCIWGLLPEALQVFKLLPERDAVSWTTIIAGYVRNGYMEDALDSFDQMLNEWFSPSAMTFACVLKACSVLALKGRGQGIHTGICIYYPLELDSVVRNALIDMYARCGLLKDAERVFVQLPVKEAASWNALIAGYSQTGKNDQMLCLLDQMIKSEQYPDVISFIGILTACTHMGLVEQGILFFRAMSEDYGILGNLEHLTCVVDLFGRAGQLSNGMLLIQKMPRHPNLVTFHTLLSSSRREGNMDLGLELFVHAIEVDEGNTGTYVTLFNIYVGAGD
ncbi:hypothetical protein KP509_05G039500 [Ceratopteris richardii]|nr:hypothetical protein KP509_05G039500 [Ceratopteris richardii]